MQCLLGIGGDPDFVRHYQDLNRQWYGRMAAAIARRRAPSGTVQSPSEWLPTAYALGGMVDEFLSQIHLRRDPALSHLADDEAAVADILTDIWWRTVGGETRNRD